MKTESSPDDIYVSHLQNVQFSPVFIIGLHRSGTSILYKMLGETELFNIVTAYHILKYDEILHNHINKLEDKVIMELNNLFKEKNIKTRKTDHMTVNSDYAHEYMYIFSERNYPWKITDKNKWLLDELCKKIIYISENDKPVLLKNPHDYANFIFIKQIYPDAKFIFIHRNPLYVISSIMRFWQTQLKEKNKFTAMYSKQYNYILSNPLVLLFYRVLFASKFPIGIFIMIRRCIRGTNYLLKNIEQLNEDDYISIRYEELCREPNVVIKRIIDYLNLKSDKDFRKAIQPRKLDLIPEVRFLKKYIFKRMKQYFKNFKYYV